MEPVGKIPASTRRQSQINKPLAITPIVPKAHFDSLSASSASTMRTNSKSYASLDSFMHRSQADMPSLTHSVHTALTESEKTSLSRSLSTNNLIGVGGEASVFQLENPHSHQIDPNLVLRLSHSATPGWLTQDPKIQLLPRLDIEHVAMPLAIVTPADAHGEHIEPAGVILNHNDFPEHTNAIAVILPRFEGVPPYAGYQDRMEELFRSKKMASLVKQRNSVDDALFSQELSFGRNTGVSTFSATAAAENVKHHKLSDKLTLEIRNLENTEKERAILQLGSKFFNKILEAHMPLTNDEFVLEAHREPGAKQFNNFYDRRTSASELHQAEQARTQAFAEIFAMLSAPKSKITSDVQTRVKSRLVEKHAKLIDAYFGQMKIFAEMSQSTFNNAVKSLSSIKAHGFGMDVVNGGNILIHHGNIHFVDLTPKLEVQTKGDRTINLERLFLGLTSRSIISSWKFLLKPEQQEAIRPILQAIVDKLTIAGREHNMSWQAQTAKVHEDPRDFAVLACTEMMNRFQLKISP